MDSQVEVEEVEEEQGDGQEDCDSDSDAGQGNINLCVRTGSHDFCSFIEFYDYYVRISYSHILSFFFTFLKV